MKNKYVLSVLACLLCALAASLTAFAAATTDGAGMDLAAGEYNLSPATQVQFSVRNFAFTTVQGKFAHSMGKIVIAGNFADSKVNVDVETQGIGTDNEKRDEHLRSADFFKVSEFPKMSFASTKITGVPPDFKVEGTLTIAGTSQTEILDVHLVSNESGKLHLTADTTLDRSHYKMTSGASIGNSVKVHLDVQAEKSASAL